MNPQQRIQQIEDFLDALIAGIQEAQQSGEVLSEEFENTLSALIESEMLELQQLKSQLSPADGLPPGQAANEVQGAQYPSSNIFGYKYDPKSQNLLVKFMGKDTADGGPIYQYSDIKPNIYDIIERGSIAPRTSGKNRFHSWKKGVTPSHGASVYALLKMGNHPYARIG